MNSAKITLWKNFGQFFQTDFRHQARVCEKTSFLNISCISKFGIYINLGCRFEFRMQKLPYERISGNFFRFHRFWSSGPCMQKDNFPILAVIQNIWDLHKFGLQIWIHNAKITLWKNFGQFFRFHRFSYKKRSFLNISCNSKYMGFT